MQAEPRGSTNTLRSRLLIGTGLWFFASVWLSATTLIRFFACLSCGHWPSLLRLGLLIIIAIAMTVGAAAVFVRTLRAEVRAIDAHRERYRDKDAPPWAQQ